MMAANTDTSPMAFTATVLAADEQYTNHTVAGANIPPRTSHPQHPSPSNTQQQARGAACDSSVAVVYYPGKPRKDHVQRGICDV